jgi:hypothetical protein
MARTIRRLRSSVQKVCSGADLTSAEAKLAEDVVVGICATSSCHLSEIARVCGGSEPLIRTERRYSKGLAKKTSGLDDLRYSYLATVGHVAQSMPFICVDGSDASKPYGKAFQYLGTISDRSDRERRVGRGYWLAYVEATDAEHRNLPLWSEVVSTEAPTYTDWFAAYRRAIIEVGWRCNFANATWLFDRGFDDASFMSWLTTLDIAWVVRQKQDRNVVLGNGTVIVMHQLASTLRTPYEVAIPYVDKSTHEPSTFTASFGYAPVRLPNSDQNYFMLVIDCGRKEPMVLLTNVTITSVKHATSIVRAYVRRWGCEEGLRCWKQKTGIEDFRVQRWEAIQRIVMLSMIAYGLQALLLLTQPALAMRYIDLVKCFIPQVLFQHYRLWDGIQIALHNSE